MLKHVLAVARAEVQPAEQVDLFAMQAADVRVHRRLLAELDDLLFDLGPRLVDDLFDPRGVDAAVLNQPFERKAGHLAPHRVERTDHDDARRVVDITSTPSPFNARMLRPSRPMTRPFMSSDWMSIALTVWSLGGRPRTAGWR